jgi:hypothetical protein
VSRVRDLETVRRASLDVPVPDYIELTDSEVSYWARIVEARHPDDWTHSDLELVADLCRARALEKRVRDELDQGALMLDGKPHPLIAEAARCNGVVMRLTVALRLRTPAEARVLRGRAAERTQSAYGDDGDDDLIPRFRDTTRRIN